ncbi:hypothetical protein D3C85_1810030 [compost metagenome]
MNCSLAVRIAVGSLFILIWATASRLSLMPCWENIACAGMTSKLISIMEMVLLFWKPGMTNVPPP